MAGGGHWLAGLIDGDAIGSGAGCEVFFAAGLETPSVFQMNPLWDAGCGWENPGLHGKVIENQCLSPWVGGVNPGVGGMNPGGLAKTLGMAA